MDRRAPTRKYREHRRRALAHIRHHALPKPGGLPDHAGGTDDVAVAAEELLLEKSGAGCAAELLCDAEPEGEFAEEGSGG